jgi:orotidine-5'-phosphate decarboxylase
VYLELLRRRSQEVGHILCLGIDPDLSRLKLSLAEWEDYVNDLLERLPAAAIKPNGAYFEALGSAGWAWLERLMQRWRGQVPMILDVKRGDIGPSSAAYARSAFEVLGADAVTVNPWMGKDSVQPFARYGPERGHYILVRTSNPGHADLQPSHWRDLLQTPYFAGAGAVVGATDIEDLRWCARHAPADCPLLIPGVGSQGGEAAKVLAALVRPEIHRVNVSSKILYAYEDYPGLPPLEAAVAAFEGYAAALRI